MGVRKFKAVPTLCLIEIHFLSSVIIPAVIPLLLRQKIVIPDLHFCEREMTFHDNCLTLALIDAVLMSFK